MRKRKAGVADKPKRRPGRPAKHTVAEAYEAHKEVARRYAAAKSRDARDVAPIPAVVDPARRARCGESLQAFCETYFAERFNLAWSDDHLTVLATIERSVRDGGLFALAMPRGSGKTSICEAACLWAALYGYHPFVMLVGATAAHGAAMLENLKASLETNDALLADFPEVCWPIRQLERQTRRCIGQLCDGKPTYIEWKADRMVLPMIPGSVSSCVTVRVAGLLGKVRGAVFTRPDGRQVRPSLVIVDDPQTDASANSLSQCVRRANVIGGAILNLAGPGAKLSAVMPCTVIRKGDLADDHLDREQHPEWQGVRTKALYSWPTATALWDEYATLRRDSLASGGRGENATEFYRANREAMDAGAVVAWPARHKPDELSGLQHLMNLHIRDSAMFLAEYQNEPVSPDDQYSGALSVGEVAKRCNGRARGEVPAWASRLTAFIDVQGEALFWLVVAWSDGYAGAIVDYGTEPDQRAPYFRLHDIKHTLSSAGPPGATLLAQVYAGLDRLCPRILGREYQREDGPTLRVSRCLVDANWGVTTETVYEFCRRSAYASVLTPSHGKYVGAASLPFGEHQRRAGERVGDGWREGTVEGRPGRRILYDTNWWKTHVQRMLKAPLGERASITLFGSNPDRHLLLAEHLTAEYGVDVTGRGRTVEEWKVRPDRPDNHWWDCLVGCAVAASRDGATFGALPDVPKTARRVIRLSELQKQRRAERERR